MNSTGRVAFVTGAASGIGKALATALAARGDTVVLADIEGDPATAIAAELRSRGLRARSLALDVRDHDAVERAIDGVYASDGRLDLLFNNAGVGVFGETQDFGWEHWQRVVGVNILGVAAGVQAAYPRMRAAGHGHIVNTASLAGLLPSPMLTPYAMTKHAVVGLSLSLRVEAAAFGVRVSAVCPGVTDTPILDRVAPEGLRATVPEGHGRDYLLHASRGRAYRPEDLARDILRGVDRNDALIIAPREARIAWRMYRHVPSLIDRRLAEAVRWSRTQRAKSDAAVTSGC